ncbi:MAG: L,D-transpeptidase family protein [Ferruginibacter sp.]
MRKFLYFLLIAILIVAAYYFYPEQKLPVGVPVTKLVVFKSKRKLQVFSGEKLLKTYTVSIGKNPLGDKKFEGDNKTPEGAYFINGKNPNSTCYKNLGISYPNDTDREEARLLQRPTGGDIKIHGLKNGQGFTGKFHRFKDWTNGCIAVTDTEMDELYFNVPVGTPIIIYP